MFATSLRRAVTCAVVGVLAVRSLSIQAMSGGVPVDELLAAQPGSRFTQQQIAFAHAISAVTVALIKLDANGTGASLCSATIVHPRVVLTAAHCVLNGVEVSRRITVLFERVRAERQALDVIVHPGFLQNARARVNTPGPQRLKHARSAGNVFSLSKDLALILLARPIPEGYELVAPVPPGFRDSRAFTKLVAGYGAIGASGSMRRPLLRFAEMHGNSRLYQGAIAEEGEIVMESKYVDGARVNVCAGDSGGPILVLERGAARLRQLAVTSAADEDCREAGIFAPIDAQRAALRSMFDALMRGEGGGDQNPF